MLEMTTLTRTVLIADDEPLTLRAIQSILADQGFTVRPACDGTVGLALVDACGDDAPQLLITDVDMPGCSGEELASYARQKCHDIKILFTSGLPHSSLVKAIAEDANSRFLEKPFMKKDLLAALGELGIL